MLKLNLKEFASSLIAFVALLIIPRFLTRYYLSLLTNVLCWVGLAISWQFFSGTTKYISLGSAAFFGVGVYVTASFLRVLPFPIILLLASVITFSLATIVGFVTLRLKGIFFAIFTFGLAELFNNVILFWEMKVTGTRGRSLIPFDVYYPMLIVVFVAFLSFTFLKNTRMGLALRAIGENEDAAVHFGVNATLYKVLSFAVSSMFIGLIGATFAPRWGYIDSGIAFNSFYSFMPAIMTLFGGVDTIYGAIIGAAALSTLEEYLLTGFKEYFMLIFGSAMILTILFMPDGIIGSCFKKLKYPKKQS